MSIDFEIRKNNKDIFKGAKDEAIERALEVIGMTAEGYAKMKCPVDTGNLRNSINHTTRDNEAYIGTNVEYAAYVELGHTTPSGTRVAAQPYLRPAVTNHIPEYRQLVLNELKRG